MWIRRPAHVAPQLNIIIRIDRRYRVRGGDESATGSAKAPYPHRPRAAPLSRSFLHGQPKKPLVNGMILLAFGDRRRFEEAMKPNGGGMPSIAELEEKFASSLGKRLEDLTDEEHEAFGVMIAQGLREAATRETEKKE
ncbi:MAG: hypothetical protein EKK29_21940 [Hyphomicrobiales bacterium]|nr:MAG: hypothetical protein EKK29_21940 [Hyphomicrobiales bacterium]